MGHSMTTTEQQADQQAQQQAEFEAAYAAWIGTKIELFDNGLGAEFDEVLDDGDIALLREPFTNRIPAWA